MSDSGKIDVKNFGFRLKCLSSSLDMYGDYDAFSASNFYVAFVRCTPETGLKCKSDQEFAEWLSLKYFLTITNEKKFISHEFGEDSRISKLSKPKWYPLQPESRVDYVEKLQIKEMEMDDSLWNLFGSTYIDKDVGFIQEVKNSRAITYSEPF